MTEESSFPLKRMAARFAAGVITCYILLFIGRLIYQAGNDSTPTVYHHEDGTFSLNRGDGPKIAPDDLLKYLRRFDRFGKVRLICNSQSRLEDWIAILDRGGEAGAGRYQFESGGDTFDFFLPLSDGFSYGDLKPDTRIINLSEIPDPILDDLPGADVVILVDSETTCMAAVQSATSFNGMNKSIVVVTAVDSLSRIDQWKNDDLRTVFLNHRIDLKLSGTFKRRNSEAWNKYVQPAIDHLKSLF